MSTREEIELRLNLFGEAAVKKFREANGVAPSQKLEIDHGGNGTYLQLQDGHVIAQVYGGEYWEHLFAASALILEALENILYDNPGCMCANCEQGRDAVKKAKGDSE